MKIMLWVSLAFVVVCGCGFALWFFIKDYSFSEEASLALINVFSVVAATIATYIITTEREEKKFRRELLDKFLDEAAHWVYYPEDRELQKSHEGYLAGLFARYHRVRAGIKDQSDLQEFGQRFDEFRKQAEIYKGPDPRGEDDMEKAIQRMTDFLRSHYLK
jgi:hypothetical protein